MWSLSGCCSRGRGRCMRDRQILRGIGVDETGRTCSRLLTRSKGTSTVWSSRGGEDSSSQKDLSYSIDCVLHRSSVPIDNTDEDESEISPISGIRLEISLWWFELWDEEEFLVGDASGVGCKDGGAELDLVLPWTRRLPDESVKKVHLEFFLRYNPSCSPLSREIPYDFGVYPCVSL